MQDVLYPPGVLLSYPLFAYGLWFCYEFPLPVMYADLNIYLMNILKVGIRHLCYTSMIIESRYLQRLGKGRVQGSQSRFRQVRNAYRSDNYLFF